MLYCTVQCCAVEEVHGTGTVQKCTVDSFSHVVSVPSIQTLSICTFGPGHFSPAITANKITILLLDLFVRLLFRAFRSGLSHQEWFGIFTIGRREEAVDIFVRRERQRGRALHAGTPERDSVVYDRRLALHWRELRVGAEKRKG